MNKQLTLGGHNTDAEGFVDIGGVGEIIVDATYKTNALGYELYAVIGQFDGTGFAMAYLFVEGNKKNDGACTEILFLFFKALYDLGMKNIQFFLTDKDFAQISAAQKIWPRQNTNMSLAY